MQMQAKKVKGFSLLELLVVVVVIGIISSVAYTPFTKWKSDREARNGVDKISSFMRDIFSQVQRGNYGFVKFEISKVGNDKNLLLVSRGLDMESYAGYLRNRYNEDGVPSSFSQLETRCGSGVDSWTDNGDQDDSPLSVNQLTLTDVTIAVEGTDTSKTSGAVCFNKDGTYYSTSGFFYEGGHIESMYVCNKTSSTKDGCAFNDDDKGGPHDDNKNTFKISWGRFGNIDLEKWVDRGEGIWVSQ